MNQRKLKYENQEINKVLKYQQDEIKNFERLDLSETEKIISQIPVNRIDGVKETVKWIQYQCQYWLQ